MPHLIIIAGPNGAGKTTTAPAILDKALHIDDFVNADIIAQGLSAFQPGKMAIYAGRIMLNRIHNLAKEKIDFAFETTLSSKSFAVWIPKIKREGYQFHLTFLWLKSADLAVSRVNERVKLGGHSVPESVIRRRYKSGLENFFRLYKPISNSWQFYDNSNSNKLILIASETNQNEIIIQDKITWNKLLEEYCNEK